MLFIPKLTWFMLFSIGKKPILDGENIFIGDHQLVVSEGCLGSDNLYFVLTTLLIYFCVFRLRKFKKYSYRLLSYPLLHQFL